MPGNPCSVICNQPCIHSSDNSTREGKHTGSPGAPGKPGDPSLPDAPCTHNGQIKKKQASQYEDQSRGTNMHTDSPEGPGVPRAPGSPTNPWMAERHQVGESHVECSLVPDQGSSNETSGLAALMMHSTHRISRRPGWTLRTLAALKGRRFHHTTPGCRLDTLSHTKHPT